MGGGGGGSVGGDCACHGTRVSRSGHGCRRADDHLVVVVVVVFPVETELVVTLVALVALVGTLPVVVFFLLKGHLLLFLVKCVVDPQCLHEVLFLRLRLPEVSRSVSIAFSRSLLPDFRLSCTFGTYSLCIIMSKHLSQRGSSSELL